MNIISSRKHFTLKDNFIAKQIKFMNETHCRGERESVSSFTLALNRFVAELSKRNRIDFLVSRTQTENNFFCPFSLVSLANGNGRKENFSV